MIDEESREILVGAEVEQHAGCVERKVLLGEKSRQIG